MLCLRSLFIDIRGLFLLNTYIIEMLQPLKEVKVAKSNFRVRIPWPRVIALTKNEGIDHMMIDQDFPFEIIRPAKVMSEPCGGMELVDSSGFPHITIADSYVSRSGWWQ